MNNLPTEAIWEHSDEVKKQTNKQKKTSVIRSKLERVEYKNRKVS